MADNVNTGAPKFAKNRKLGKNKKKSWRAAKVDDIEEFLQDERRQLLAGGLVTEKSDESLFVLDTGTEDKKEQNVGSVAGRRTKRGQNTKPLKCLALLQPDPHSKVVRKPDSEAFQKGKRSQPVLERIEARSKSQTKVMAEAQRLQSVEDRNTKRAKKRKFPTVESDVWADSNDGSAVTVKPPKKYRQKPSALSATVIPHPGASVNPTFEDHQDLLFKARGVEVQKVQKEKKIYNALDAKFPSKEDAPNESTYLEEMSAGLVDNSEDDSSEDDTEETTSVNPPVRREDRKTRKQRKVEQETQVQKKEKKMKTEIKQREHMVYRIPSIKKELNHEVRQQKAKAAKKSALMEQMPYKTRRLGKIKYETPDLDLKLSSELVGSLREVTPEGHVLKDIYKSLQRRNIVEPRIRQKNKRKYKPKVFEKKTHKEVTL